MTDEPERHQGEEAHPFPAEGTGRAGRGVVLLSVGTLLLLAGALGIGGWGAYRQQQGALQTQERHRDFVPTVQVAEVLEAGDTINVSLPGTTQALTTANMFARASGYITKRPVDIGDHVKAYDLLAEITAPELDHQIEQAQANLQQTQATLRQNQANLDLGQITWNRDRPLVAEGWTTRQQGSIDQQNLKAFEAAVGAAKQAVGAQEQALRVLQQAKAYQTVVAPFDGVVTARNIDVGSLVQADATTGTFMFTVMQTNVIRTFVYVPQDAAVGVVPGIDAVIHVPELPGQSFPGKVTRIADALQPDTRTLLTEIDVKNPDNALQPGKYVTVELRIPRKGKLLTVPSDAVVFDADGLHVAVLVDGVARFHKVHVVNDLGTQVQVDDGVRPGDLVIRSPAVNLADGSRVQSAPVKEAAK